MEQLLQKWSLNSLEQQENFRIKCERKQSNWEESEDFTLNPLTFKELDEDLDQGFIKVESNFRIQVLKEKDKKPIYMENLQNTNTDLVTVSTFGLSQKKKKLKNKHTNKVQSSKLKFLSIANVKGDWFEVKNFSLPQNINALNSEYNVEVLKEVNETLIKIKPNIFNIKPKRPFKIPQNSQDLTLPMNIQEDEFLMDIYKNLNLDDDEVAFFMPDFIFNNFTSIYFKNFPWNLNIIKNKNKFILSADINSENPFLFLQTYNENNMNKLSEIEIDVFNNNMESTMVEQSFYQLLTEQQDIQQLKHNYRYLKIKLPDGISIYTKLSLDALKSNSDSSNLNDNLVLLRTFNNIKKWKNFRKNHIQIVNECLKNNMGRVMEWMTQAILTETNEVYIGMLERVNVTKNDQHCILKVEKKKLEQLMKFFNLKQESIFNGFKYMLSNIRNLSNDGNYILHKEFFKNQFVIYRLPKSN